MASRITALVPACLLILAGGVAAQHTTPSTGSDVAIALLVASIIVLPRRLLRGPACFGLGYALFTVAGNAVVDGRLDAIYAGDSMLASVRVAGFPQRTRQSVSLLVESTGDGRIPGRVRLTWFRPPVMPMPGDVWELEMRLSQPRGGANPGVFDRETWLFREKVHASGYVVAGKRNRLLWSGAVSRRDELRRRFVARARAAAESDEAGAVLAAVGVGARHLVTREQWTRFAATGTSHLMAISGLHIGLAALCAFAIGFGLAGLMPGDANSLVAALLLSVALAAVYAWLSGFGVPARRAIIMLGASALIVARRRQVDAFAVVSFAAIVVFISDPVATLAPGFHLSFAAVILLLWLARRRDTASGRWRPVVGIRRLFVMQVFLLFGLLPLTAIIFHRFALVATPVNLIAVPAFSFITAPLTLAALAIGEHAESASIALLHLAAHSVDGLEALISFAADLPYAHFRLVEIRGTASLILLVPLAWIVLPPGWPARRIAVLGALAIVCWKPDPAPQGCFDTWVLDVGQGLAVVIQTGQGVVLYDTGMAWQSGGSIAQQVITPFLQSRGLSRIDRLVISHSDLDHSGGLNALEQDFDIGHTIVGEPLADTVAWRCIAGQGWWQGAVHFEMLHPLARHDATGNDASCVLRVSAGPHSLLLTGDIEAAAERDLVQRRARLGADVVVVPHHGSLTSSSVPFVDSVHPDVAIVSSAYANRWGFPKDAVVERWQASGAAVLNTARDGAVYLRTCAADGLVELRREREERRRFWHAD